MVIKNHFKNIDLSKGNMRKKRLILGLGVFLMFLCFRSIAQTWSGKIRLTWSGTFNNDPDIAVDSGDNIHVVWQDEAYGAYEVLYKNSINAGSSWSPLAQLTWSTELSYRPAIAVDTKNRIYIVFYEFGDLYLKIGTQ